MRVQNLAEVVLMGLKLFGVTHGLTPRTLSERIRATKPYHRGRATSFEIIGQETGDFEGNTPKSGFGLLKLSVLEWGLEQGAFGNKRAMWSLKWLA